MTSSTNPVSAPSSMNGMTAASAATSVQQSSSNTAGDMFGGDNATNARLARLILAEEVAGRTGVVTLDHIEQQYRRCHTVGDCQKHYE